jgi:hypothetical protein
VKNEDYKRIRTSKELQFIEATEIRQVREWIKCTWNQIPTDLVVKCFKKCGNSNSLDDCEYGLVWDIDEDEVSSDGSDVYE